MPLVEPIKRPGLGPFEAIGRALDPTGKDVQAAAQKAAAKALEAYQQAQEQVRERERQKAAQDAARPAGFPGLPQYVPRSPIPAAAQARGAFMPLWQCEIVFQYNPAVTDDLQPDASPAGWTEVYYSDVVLEPALRVNLGILCEKRGALLSGDCTILCFKYSDTAVFGDVYTQFKPAFLRFAPESKLDTSQKAAEVRQTNGNLYRRLAFLRGIPDFVVNPAVGEALNRARWYAALGAYNDFMAGAVPFGSLFKLKGLDNPFAPIEKIVVGGAGYLMTTSTALPGVAIGSQVQIYNVRESPGFSGVYILAGPIPGAAPWVYSLIAPNAVVFPYKGKGKVKPNVLGYRKFLRSQFERFGVHKMGRVFGAPVGRRKRRLVGAR